MIFCYFGTWLGSVIGSLFLVNAIVAGEPAQQAAGAAIALALAVIPYVFSRAIEKLGAPREIELAHDTLVFLRACLMPVIGADGRPILELTKQDRISRE